MNRKVVYSDTAVTSADGEIVFNKATDFIMFLNKDHNDFVEIKLNGGPHTFLLLPASHKPDYLTIEGNYGSFEVLTASANVAVIAFG